MVAAVHRIVAALVRRDDSLLLVRQQGPWDLEASWMVPGGRVEPGEELADVLACGPLERYLSELASGA